MKHIFVNQSSRKLFLLSILVFLFLGFKSRVVHKDFISQESPYGVEETMAKLKKAVEAKGLTIFVRVKHDQGARKAGLELNKTWVLQFGNPKAGTVLMKCDPRVGLMLPLKILIWEDQEKKTHIGYMSPDFLDKHYNLDSEACQGIIQKMKKLLASLVKEATSRDMDE